MTIKKVVLHRLEADYRSGDAEAGHAEAGDVGAVFLDPVSGHQPPLSRLEARGQCYKTFYGRKLRIFRISCSVCPGLAFPA